MDLRSRTLIKSKVHTTIEYEHDTNMDIKEEEYQQEEYNLKPCRKTKKHPLPLSSCVADCNESFTTEKCNDDPTEENIITMDLSSRTLKNKVHTTIMYEHDTTMDIKEEEYEQDEHCNLKPCSKTNKYPLPLSSGEADCNESFAAEKCDDDPTEDSSIGTPRTPDAALQAQHHNSSLKPLTIVLTRSQLDSPPVVSVPDEGSRPKRKAALYANANLKSYYVAEDFKNVPSKRKTRTIDSDDDWKSNSENETDKEESDSQGSDENDSNSINCVRKGSSKTKSTRNSTIRKIYFEVVKRFKCQIKSCEMKFNFSKELQSHSLESGHKNQKKYKCRNDQCSKVFYRKCDMKTHMNTAHLTRTSTTCQLCLKKFRNEKLLSVHQYRCHKKNFKCDLCQRTFYKKVNLKHHSKLHVGNSNECKICSTKFIWEISLKKHTCVEHNGKTFQCKHCGKIFTKRINLTQHYSRHLKSKIGKVYPCAGCKKIHFVEKIWDSCIIKHFRKGRLRGLTCAICAKVFNKSKELDQHSFETGHLNKKHFKCNLCTKWYYRQKDIKDHKRDHFVKCDLCAHKNIHTDCKHFKCTICEERFHSERQLENHVKKCVNEKGNFECRFCIRVFDTRAKLKMHGETHKWKTKYFPCKICGKVFQTRSWVLLHMKTHSSDARNNSICCSECDLTFRYIRELQHHERSIHFIGDLTKKMPPDQFKCKQCDKTFNNKYSLNSHLVIHSDGRPLSSSVECPICLHRFATQFNLKNHMIWHTNPEGDQEKDSSEKSHSDDQDNFKSVSRKGRFECLFCIKIFDTEAKLKKHRIIHKGRLGKFPCKFCGKMYNRRKSALGHMRTHLRTDHFKCTECDKTFHAQCNLTSHLLSHSEERPFPCSLCEMKFKSNYQLNRHFAKHANIRVICDVCGKTFSDSDHLRTHKRLHNGTLFPCPSCDRKFYDNSALREHIKVVHDQIAVEMKNVLFPCEVCPKSFTNKQSLNIHFRRHTGEKPYSCEKCNKSFITKGALVGHVNIYHAEKNIKCDNCFKSFAGKELLNQHVKRVHGNKNFQCEFCPYSCRQKAHLETHIRTQHTKERPFVCHVCGKSFGRKNYLDIHIKSIHDKAKAELAKADLTDSESDYSD